MALVMDVVRQIEAAFRDVTHPGDAAMLNSDCLDDHEDDVRALRGFLSWQSIPDKVIESENAGLTALSPRAFQFYLPAYMKWSLLNLRASSAFTSDATIYALAPTASRIEQLVSRYSLLSPAQVRAVVSFLRIMADSPDFADADTAMQALRSYWLPRLESGA
jgi:hypothetical protein